MSFPVGRRGQLLAAVGVFVVGCPGAVAQVRPAEESAGPAIPAEPQRLDPQSPMADLPGLGVDWPDLSKAPTEPVAATSAATVTGEVRYSYRVDGIDSVASALLRERFDQ
ncbi:MAG: outer membrane protein assembly factor, partial [Sphingomonas sp.]